MKKNTKIECIDLSSTSSVSVSSKRFNKHIMERMGNKTFIVGDLKTCIDIASKLEESCFIYVDDIGTIQVDDLDGIQ